MGKLSLIHVQSAIRTLLLADGTLCALLASTTAIYDGVPDDAAYPYIAFGEKHTEPWDTFSGDANDDRIMLYVWSQAKGDLEALTIASRVNDLLHGSTLDLASAGFRMVPSSLQLEMLDTMREPDGRTRKAMMRFKLQAEEV